MKKNDLILIASLIIIAFAILLGQRLWQKSNTTENAYVVVTVDGQEYARYTLKEDREETITLDNGAFNKLVISDGKVSMEEASCPDKICVNHAAIHYSNESIVCLPNKVVVTIEGGEDNEVDAITN